MIEQYLPIILVLVVAAVFATAIIFTSKLFGPQRPNKVKEMPYESGKNPFGTAKERVSIKYYLVAMLFIIFDIEVIYLYPWGVEFRNLYNEHGFVAFWPMLVFLIVLELGFLYVYKKGALKWD